MKSAFGVAGLKSVLGMAGLKSALAAPGLKSALGGSLRGCTTAATFWAHTPCRGWVTGVFLTTSLRLTGEEDAGGDALGVVTLWWW